ncbi:CocE/NonD family hydrolase [Nocardia gipuzkoensis]
MSSAMFDLRVARDLSVPMPDGERLLADRYYRASGAPGPTILVRSPMGRRPLGIIYGLYFVRAGFQVVVQDGRAAEDVLPLSTERADGLATIEWLRGQVWFDGRLALHGMSAMGFAHWAIAADIPELRAVSVHVAASSVADTIFTGGSTALESVLIWCSNHSFITALRAPRRARRAIASGRPAAELDVLTGGRTVSFYQAVIADIGAGSPLRDLLDHARAPAACAGIPVHLVGGWYDIFLPGLVRDYAALSAAGGAPRLTIGPWGHYNLRQFVVANREARQWFHAHLRGGEDCPSRRPVRLFVTGARRWREYASWPPPGTSPVRWHLREFGRLSRMSAERAGSDHFRYDPADPTPAPRGPVIVGFSRPQDCRQIESRPDLLTYTSDPLGAPLEIIGTVVAELRLRIATAHPPRGRGISDVVVRVCDVHPGGRSFNICEGVRRVEPPTDEDDIRVELWPIAHRFATGHQLRVQVCGAAVPRYMRQPDPAAYELIRDPSGPSSVILPTVPTGLGTR